MAREYTGDLVLRQVRENGRMVWAWVPRAEARQIQRQEDELREIRQAAAAPPPPATPTYQAPAAAAPAAPAAPPTIVPILTPGQRGDEQPGADIRQQNPSVPAWWINSAIQNPTTDAQRFANTANALLPTLAPEDQRNLANYLATNFGDVYGRYANTNFGMAPTEITTAVRNRYLSPQRAQEAITLLDRMKAAAGTGDMGRGYDFLRNAVGLINQFSEGGPMTREAYNQFAAAVNGMITGAGAGLGQYGNLAQLFNLPRFSAGPLVSNTPNSELYT